MYLHIFLFSDILLPWLTGRHSRYYHCEYIGYTATTITTTTTQEETPGTRQDTSCIERCRSLSTGLWSSASKRSIRRFVITEKAPTRARNIPYSRVIVCQKWTVLQTWIFPADVCTERCSPSCCLWFPLQWSVAAFSTMCGKVSDITVFITKLGLFNLFVKV